MRKNSYLLIAAVAVLLISGCSFYIGSGIAIDTEYNLDGFTSVEARAASEVTIVRGDEYSVKVTSDDNLVNSLDVSVIGDSLVIDLKPGISFSNRIFKAVVVMPAISSVKIAEASRLKASGFETSSLISVDVSGAASGELSFISTGNINANVRDAGNLSVSSVSPAGNLDIICSSASKADFSSCAADDVKVSITGAGTAWVNLDGYLSGTVAEASKLFYKGAPIVSNISINTAASISTY